MLSLCAMVLILFGTMALMNLVTAQLQPEGVQTLVGKVDDPLSEAMRHSEGYAVFRKAMLVPTILAGIAGVVAGIAVLRGSELARKAGIVWAVAYLFMGFATAGANIWFGRVVIDKMEMPPAVKPEMVDSLRAGLMNSVLIGAGFTTVFVVALSVAVVVLLTRSDSVAFCTLKPFSDSPATKG